MPASRLFASFLLAAALLHATGCGSSNPNPAVTREKADLTEIYQAYQHFIKSQEKPPAELGDLTQTRYQMNYPAAIKALQEGKYVAIYNVSAKDGGTVLAYDKDAPDKGGPVLMANGTVKIMTAQEFAAKRTP